MMNHQTQTTPRKERHRAEGEGRSMRRFTLASVVVHLLILLVVGIPLSRPQRPIFADPVYPVAYFQSEEPNLVPPRPVRVDPDPAPPAVDPQTEAPAMEEIPVPPEQSPPRPGRALEEAPPKPRPKPPAQVAPPPPERRRKPPVRREDVEKTRSPAPAEPVPRVSDAPPDRPVSLGQVDQEDFRDLSYLESVRWILQRNWSPPVTGADRPLAVVHFTIRRDGSAYGARLVRTSASRLYDREALAAVQRVRRFPPLPASFPGDELGLTVNFLAPGGADAP